jgi:SAGA-associated factor 73
MGAKRSVQGRSRGYDELLLDWQRLHNPNFVEPVKRETKKEKKEKKEKEREEKKKAMDQKKAMTAAKKAATKKGSTNVSTQPSAEGREFEDEDVDSEVELESMIRSVREARDTGRIGVPIAFSGETGVGAWFVVRRERVRCCRDQLLGALQGNRSGIGAVPGLMRPTG